MPPHPVVGVGAVVLREGKVLLIRRGKEPLKGRWLVPGGTVEWGETLEDAVAREVLEETGVRVRAREVALVFDRIDRADDAVRHHYVIVDFLCDDLGGEPRAGSDAADAAFVAGDDLDRYQVPPAALSLIRRYLP